MAKVNLGSMQNQSSVEAFNKLENFAGKLQDGAKIRATKEKGIYGSTSGGTFGKHWKKGARLEKRNELHKQLQSIGEQCFGKDPLMKAAWEATIGRANLSNQHDLTGKEFKQIVADMGNALDLAGLADDMPEVAKQPQSPEPRGYRQRNAPDIPQHARKPSDSFSIPLSDMSSNASEISRFADSKDFELSSSSNDDLGHHPIPPNRDDRSNSVSSSSAGTEFPVEEVEHEDYEQFINEDVKLAKDEQQGLTKEAKQKMRDASGGFLRWPGQGEDPNVK